MAGSPFEKASRSLFPERHRPIARNEFSQMKRCNLLSDVTPTMYRSRIDVQKSKFALGTQAFVF